MHQIIKIRNELDRFGFSYYLAEKMGLSFPPRSFANWQHGWIWWELILPETLGYSLLYYDVPTIVPNDKHKRTLVDLGFRYVVSGGLPFSYIEKSSNKRIKNSLLAIPTHTLDYMGDVNVNFYENINFLDKLQTYKKYFTKISCLIYYDDYIKGRLINECSEREIIPICGARANAKGSHQRIRSIFDSYEYVTSNAIGSAVLYAMFAGCKVSLIEPFFSHSKKYWNDDPYIRKNNELLQHTIKVYSKEYLKKRFEFLFKNHPIEGIYDKEWADYEIGYNNHLDLDEIREILGWSFLGKYRGYARGLKRRIINKFSRKK